MAQGLQYKKISKDTYLIYKGGDEYGIFRLIPVVPPNPTFCKHMELLIYQNAAEKIINDGDLKLLLRIYRFVFDSVLKITHELKGAELCKLYSDNRLLSMVYRDFSQNLSKKHYEVKIYGNWIEVKKSEKSSGKKKSL